MNPSPFSLCIDKQEEVLKLFTKFEFKLRFVSVRFGKKRAVGKQNI